MRAKLFIAVKACVRRGEQSELLPNASF